MFSIETEISKVGLIWLCDVWHAEYVKHICILLENTTVQCHFAWSTPEYRTKRKRYEILALRVH